MCHGGRSRRESYLFLESSRTRSIIRIYGQKGGPGSLPIAAVRANLRLPDIRTAFYLERLRYVSRVSSRAPLQLQSLLGLPEAKRWWEDTFLALDDIRKVCLLQLMALPPPPFGP